MNGIEVLPDTIGSPRGVTVDGASPELLKDLLDTFELELRQAGVRVDDLLRPGAQRAAVQREFRASDLVAPEEAIVLFGWHDGRYEVPGAWGALPVFPAWSLEYLAAKRKRVGLRPTGFGEWEWNPNWVWVMGDQHGLAMCCADDPDRSPLIRFVSDDGDTSTQDDNTEFQVVSLCTPVSWWIDSIRRGWYQWDKEKGVWHCDQQAQPLIRKMYLMT